MADIVERLPDANLHDSAIPGLGTSLCREARQEILSLRARLEQAKRDLEAEQEDALKSVRKRNIEIGQLRDRAEAAERELEESRNIRGAYTLLVRRAEAAEARCAALKSRAERLLTICEKTAGIPRSEWADGDLIEYIGAQAALRDVVPKLHKAHGEQG